VGGDGVARIVRELSTRAVRCDVPRLTVGLSWVDERSSSSTSLTPRTVAAGAKSGRGLQIVDLRAGSWGIEQSAAGRVWATLSLN
jgi:hypothetical protein